MFNKYYEVIEPLHYFERIGSAPSNTYIGASQAYDTIFEGKNAVPGDQFHLLVGGDFMLNDLGETPSVSFWIPKHLFEKTYGMAATSKQLFEQLEAAGIVREIPKPDTYISYSNISQLPTFPLGTRTITRLEQSPTFTNLSEASRKLSKLTKDNGLRSLYFDFNEDRKATLFIADVNASNRIQETILEVKVSENGRTYILPSTNSFNCEKFLSAMKSNPMVDKSRIYDASFWATDVNILKDQEFIKQVEIAIGNYLEKTNQVTRGLNP